MELSGNLRRFAVANVFQFLNMESATGKLTLRHAKMRIQILLLEGNPLDVEHSEHPKEKRMGEILVTSGRLSEEEMASAYEERRSRLVPLGTVLHDRGFITDRERQRLAALVYTDILFDALEMRDGTYEFEYFDEAEHGELEQPLSMQTIMLKAAQIEDEWPQVHRYVPSIDAVFSPSPSDTIGLEAVINSLSEEDREIAERIDGTRSVNEIAAETLRSEFEVAKLIAELSRRGVVVAIQMMREDEVDEQPKGFFSMDIGPVSLVPLAIAFTTVLLMFSWRYYASPVLDEPDRVFAPFVHAGRDGATVDRVRLQRLLQAFQLHREEQGMAPRSLDTLVRLGYCERADLKTAEGGTFLMKITGNQEERVTISAIDTQGKPIPGLSVRISLK